MDRSSVPRGSHWRDDEEALCGLDKFGSEMFHEINWEQDTELDEDDRVGILDAIEDSGVGSNCFKLRLESTRSTSKFFLGINVHRVSGMR